MNSVEDQAQKRFVVFEGYDGSGKSTLIKAVRSSLHEKSTCVVGRKSEPELIDISKIIEREDLRTDPNVEMLLRISLEVERQKIITKSILSHDVVMCDRGVISLVSWFDYLGVPKGPYKPLLKQLNAYYQNALTVVCRANFETCWQRSSSRSEQSRKDRLGMDVNRRYFSLYESNIQSHANSGSKVLFVDTVDMDITQSTALVVESLKSHGL